MRRVIGTVFLSAVATALGGCVAFPNFTATSKSHDVHPHIAGSPLVVDTRNGSIDIVADSTVSDVQIDATLRCGGDSQAEADDHLSKAIVSIVRDSSNTLTVKAILPEDDRGRHGASFVIRLPDASGVNANTSNGRITVAGLGGELIADTSNGSVKVTNHDGPVHIDTSNGGVSAQAIAGDLTVDTSNGSVDVSQIKGKVRIETSNGSISMKLDPAQTGPIHLDTSNGSIVASVGPAFAGVVKLDTSNGGISVRDTKGVIRSQTVDKSSGMLTLGSGGETSIIDTSNGRIEFIIAD
jgi:hypothetical protein